MINNLVKFIFIKQHHHKWYTIQKLLLDLLILLNIYNFINFQDLVFYFCHTIHISFFHKLNKINHTNIFLRYNFYLLQSNLMDTYNYFQYILVAGIYNLYTKKGLQIHRSHKENRTKFIKHKYLTNLLHILQGKGNHYQVSLQVIQDHIMCI